MSETTNANLSRSDDPYVRKIQDQILRSFLDLQMLESEMIASALIMIGIKGTPGNYCECALAEHFRKIVIDILPELLSKLYIEVQCDSITIELDFFGKIVLPVPDGNLRRFMEDFDEELYPDLMIEPEDPNA